MKNKKNAAFVVAFFVFVRSLKLKMNLWINI